MSYPMLDANSIKRLQGNKLLVEWEENTETMLGGKIVRPETHRGMHFTGVVLKIGTTFDEDGNEIPAIDEDIKEGDRIFFEQFSSPDGYQDTKTKKRLAIIDASAAIAIIPPRVKVGSGESGFNYDY